MKKSVLAFAVLGASIAGGSGYAVVAHRDDSKSALAPSGPVQLPQVMALGRVEPISRVVRVAGPTGTGAGRIAAIRVAERDRVKAGEVLATLDTEPALAAALQQAEANLALKRAQLAKTVVENENQERILAATLEQQEAERDRTNWELEKMARLHASGIYNEAALTDKRFALAAANRRVETARLALERNRARDAAGLRIDEATARADLATAEAAVAKAHADHAQAFVRAPISGRVLRLIGRLGEQIGSDGFAELGDTTAMSVRAEVFEGDMRFVAEGQPVQVTSRALTGTLAGRVDRIGLRVGQQSIIREDPAAVLDARVVEVLVRLDDLSSSLVEGLSNLQVRVSMPRADAPSLGVPVAAATPARNASGGKRVP